MTLSLINFLAEVLDSQKNKLNLQYYTVCHKHQFQKYSELIGRSIIKRYLF